MLDDDQGVDVSQQHGVHVDEVGGEDAAGLAVRNCFQVGPVRRGAGPIPASCRICQAVEAATGWPPWGILGTWGWTSQQMFKSSPACQPNGLRKAHLVPPGP